jgi:hypothetical protein
MCSPEIEAELAELRADYQAIRAAIAKVVGGAQQYTLNTSQTVMTVTRASLGQLRQMRLELRQEILELEAECAGGQVIQVRPNW